MGLSSRVTKTFTVSFPPDLARQVEEIAKAENRTLSELFREAFRSYRAQRMRQILRESQAEFQKNNPMGYTEADVPRVIKEYRAEKRTRNK